MSLLAFVISLFISGCYKFEGEQTVPSYLSIDTIRFSTDYATQGSNTHNISDAWVYVNGQLIGAFELPATFPVLARGKQRLEIRPGIKLNGIAATRVPYPFMKPIVLENFSFYEDSIVSINPQTTYYENLRFAWKEDFERKSITLEKTNQSDTSIYRTEPANNPEAWLSGNSAHSGLVHLEGNRKFFRIMSFQASISRAMDRRYFLSSTINATNLLVLVYLCESITLSKHSRCWWSTKARYGIKSTSILLR